MANYIVIFRFYNLLALEWYIVYRGSLKQWAKKVFSGRHPWRSTVTLNDLLKNVKVLITLKKKFKELEEPSNWITQSSYHTVQYQNKTRNQWSVPLHVKSDCHIQIVFPHLSQLNFFPASSSLTNTWLRTFRALELFAVLESCGVQIAKEDKESACYRKLQNNCIWSNKLYYNLKGSSS